MSDESPPKFRLKVKTASEPANAASAAGTPVPEPAAAPVTNEAKAIRLKPRLAEETAAQKISPVAAPEARSVAADFPPPFPPEPVPRPEPAIFEAPAAEKYEVKFKLRRKGSAPEPVAGPAAAADPAQAATPIPRFPHDGPVPAPVLRDTEEGGSPAAVTSVRNVTAMPFPPRAGNFPPPPSAARPPPPWARVPAPAVVTKRRLVVWSGAIVVILVVGAGGFFGYSKFTAEPPPPPPKAKPLALPPVSVAVKPAKEAAPVVVAAQATPAVSSPAVVAVKVVPPPPQANPEFEAWVKRLKIGGIRAGANPRVFIGGTAYATGELVNPSLGIMFETYDPETRVLTFRDTSGAKVERKN